VDGQVPDRVLVPASPCFFGTLVSVYGALAGSGSVALLPGLDAATFWPAVRRAGVTFASLLQPSLADLMAAPPSPADRDHPLRLVTASPAQAELNAAAVERFGVHWMAGLGKTEVCGAVATDVDPGPTDGVGRILDPFEGRVVDAAGVEVAAGTAGELVLRSRVAGALPAGYADDPGATALLWRDGWMHTGWHVRRDGAGSLHPVGNLSIHPVVVKRAGYLFAADLEAEIVAVTAADGARVSSRPAADPSADPIVVAWVTGDHLDPVSMGRDLVAGLPGHLVPEWIVSTDTLPERPDELDIPADAWAVSG
jgi:crotonobetaine/carnitine-CoA ligase